MLDGTDDADEATRRMQMAIVRQLPPLAADEEAVNTERPQRSEDERC